MKYLSFSILALLAVGCTREMANSMVPDHFGIYPGYRIEAGKDVTTRHHTNIDFGIEWDL
jgi:hypothetical protein